MRRTFQTQTDREPLGSEEPSRRHGVEVAHAPYRLGVDAEFSGEGLPGHSVYEVAGGFHAAEHVRFSDVAQARNGTVSGVATLCNLHAMGANSPHDPAAVGMRVRRLREINGLDQEAFARRIGVPRPDISKWETGAQKPSIAKAVRLCDAFSVDLNWLFRGMPDFLRHDMALKLSEPANDKDPAH